MKPRWIILDLVIIQDVDLGFVVAQSADGALDGPRTPEPLAAVGHPASSGGGVLNEVGATNHHAGTSLVNRVK